MKKWADKIFIFLMVATWFLIIIASNKPGPGLLVVALAIWYAGERIADALKDDESP